MMEHLEFVVEFKDGKRDWIDPVDDVVESGDLITVIGGSASCEYSYEKEDIDKWTIRPYTPETTYDPIKEEVHE